MTSYEIVGDVLDFVDDLKKVKYKEKEEEKKAMPSIISKAKLCSTSSLFPQGWKFRYVSA